MAAHHQIPLACATTCPTTVSRLLHLETIKAQRVNETPDVSQAPNQEIPYASKIAWKDGYQPIDSADGRTYNNFDREETIPSFGVKTVEEAERGRQDSEATLIGDEPGKANMGTKAHRQRTRMWLLIIIFLTTLMPLAAVFAVVMPSHGLCQPGDVQVDQDCIPVPKGQHRTSVVKDFERWLSRSQEHQKPLQDFRLEW